tara:strand:+ start:143 stop:511 length:369 start_codon:yes stop_codon:yes gene_type:complete
MDGPQTPQGMDLVATLKGGNNAVTGASVIDYKFAMVSPITGREFYVMVPYDPSFMSKAYLEDLAAQSFETFLEEEKEREMKRKPTADERKQIGGQIKEFKEYTARMRESTNNRVYYNGIPLL